MSASSCDAPSAHIQNTRAQYNLPAFERRIADPANREGVAEYFEAARVSTTAFALRDAKSEPQEVLGAASSTQLQNWKRRPL